MEIREAIQKSLKIFANEKADWEKAEEAVRNSEIPQPLAEKIIEFTPIAFGRVFLKDLGISFNDEYVRYIQSNGKLEIKYKGNLSQEFIFIESTRLATEMISMGQVNDEFQSVAFSSAEFNVVNEAMNNGSKPENLVLSSPYLPWRDELSDEILINSCKNWWQFWK